LLHPKADLLNPVCTVGNFGKIWSARGQRKHEYTE